MNNRLKIYLIFFSIVMVGCSISLSYVYADTATDLQSKIDERNNQIKQLETQIQQYNQQVDQVGKEANTLQSNLKTLDLTQKKLTTDLTLTKNKIVTATLTIEQLNGGIATTTNHINVNKKAIGAIFKEKQQLEDAGIFELLLSSKSVSDVWNDLDSLRQVQNYIKGQSDELRILTTTLESKQTNVKGQKTQLVGLQADLTGKAQAIQQTKQQKATLLAETKNKEVTYKQLLATTEAQKAQFEQDVFNFESQLKLTIDPNGYPAPHKGILSWPIDPVRITQLFGKTVGAEKLYVSGSHNGVDFGASIGTRVKNVLDGIVAGTGNTDAYPGCYSFGKWVMIKHPNGLSTIYGHLSVISVSTGQELKTGDVIGYSGNTGYSTGPHLHVGVYATQGVRIEQFVNSRGCKQAIIPLADIKAYLDPMLYFPAY